LFNPETKIPGAKWSKSYYEAADQQVLAAVPARAKILLSVGCGWGETEKHLISRGIVVTGLPMDFVIGSCAVQNGVRTAYGHLAETQKSLANTRFDCVLFSNVLHLQERPEDVLIGFSKLLNPGGTVIVATPNFASMMVTMRRVLRHPQYKDLGSYEKTGICDVRVGQIRGWLKPLGIEVTAVHPRGERVEKLAHVPSIVRRILATDLVIVGEKQANANR
jgi:trans-aconitate methyltransferase